MQFTGYNFVAADFSQTLVDNSCMSNTNECVNS